MKGVTECQAELVWGGVKGAVGGQTQTDQEGQVGDRLQRLDE